MSSPQEDRDWLTPHALHKVTQSMANSANSSLSGGRPSLFRWPCTHTNTDTHSWQPNTVVYLTSSNISEEQLRREVIPEGPIPLSEPRISACVSIFTNRAVCVRVYVCMHACVRVLVNTALRRLEYVLNRQSEDISRKWAYFGRPSLNFIITF